MITKTVIVFVFILIIASLGLALRYLFMDGERSPRTVKALTFRIGISIALFFYCCVAIKQDCCILTA